MSITLSTRWFTLGPTAVLALALLAACGGGGTTSPAETGDTSEPSGTTVPAIETTTEAETETTPEATLEPAGGATEGTPAAMASPAGAMASPAAEASPVGAMASPVSSAAEASPVGMMATPATDATPATGATPEAMGSSAATPESGAEASTSAAAQEFTVVSHDIYFDPTEFTIPADTDVFVNLPNEGAAPHNFSVDELGISVDQAPGEVKDTVINAPAGEYEYYCNVPGHKEAGMVGTLTVE